VTLFCHTAASLCVRETATHNVRHTVTLFCHTAASLCVSETATHNVRHTVTLVTAADLPAPAIHRASKYLKSHCRLTSATLYGRY